MGSRGNAPGAVRRLRNTCASKSAGGAKNSPVDCFSVGNPRRGFPIISLLLCILPSDTYFFYTKNPLKLWLRGINTICSYKLYTVKIIYSLNYACCSNSLNSFSMACSSVGWLLTCFLKSLLVIMLITKFTKNSAIPIA